MKKNWLIVFVVFIGGLSLAIAQNKVSPVLPQLIEYFPGMSSAVAGWLMSIFAVMGVIMAIPAAMIMGKLGPKKAGCISIAFGIIGCLIGIFTNSVPLLLLSRVIEGVGVGVIAVTGPSLIAMWFPIQKRGIPMAVWTCWMIVAQALVFRIAGVLVANSGWQSMWWFSLVLMAIAFILFALFIDVPPEGQNNAVTGGGGSGNLSEGFKSKNAYLLALAGFGYAVARFGFVVFIASYWNATLFGGSNQGAANGWVSMIYTIEIVWALAIGVLMNKVVNRKRLAMGGFILYAAIVAYAFNMKSAAMLIPFVIIYPLLEAVLPTVFFTIAPQTGNKPEHVGAALGIFNVGMNVGTMLGPPLAGWAIGSMQNPAWGKGSILLAVSCLVGFVFLGLVKLNTYENKGAKT